MYVDSRRSESFEDQSVGWSTRRDVLNSTSNKPNMHLYVIDSRVYSVSISYVCYRNSLHFLLGASDYETQENISEKKRRDARFSSYFASALITVHLTPREKPTKTEALKRRHGNEDRFTAHGVRGWTSKKKVGPNCTAALRHVHAT
ncbi:hypothetical protein ALC56_04954 [Trachymyrmex septentrionalis]|uniref:Uncharacterized protein n=1 Tax=Trachymyrmex septentrionalis TaxID=34720 RepID=A0A195FJ05_9HYME|nr:hypothetical protein ALC56_04954 [Trachymyrmex septentrionalis]